jgi:DNA invertase Pin-like site-specific DNA recombinase
MNPRSRKNSASQRRVVGYVRISRDRENETSTETQEKAIRSFCDAHGWTIVDVLTEPGRSAFKASRRSRPKLREALRLVSSGAADTLVVWKIDRAIRNTRDLLELVDDDLGQHGADFVSVTENFDTTTPMGKAMLSIIGVLAELESAQKSERAMEWHQHRRAKAAVPAGPAGIGYRKPAPNQLELDPVVAELVRDAAESIAAGGKVAAAVRKLNDAGVKITHRGLTTALQSPTLAGLVPDADHPLPRRGGARVLDGVELIPGTWEPLLDRDTWEKVRQVLEDPRRRAFITSNALARPLVPIARCWCGSTMHSHNERWKVRDGSSRQMARLICDDPACATGIGYDAVEAVVTEAVLGYLDGGAWAELRSRTTATPVDAAAAEAKLARLWAMVLAGTIEPEEYAEAKAAWRGQLAAAEAEPIELPDVDDVRAGWERLSPHERHLVFKASLTRLVIRKAKRRGGRGVDPSRIDYELG